MMNWKRGGGELPIRPYEIKDNFRFRVKPGMTVLRLPEEGELPIHPTYFDKLSMTKGAFYNP